MRTKKGQAFERGPMLLVGILFLSLLLGALVVIVVTPLTGDEGVLGYVTTLLSDAATSAIDSLVGGGEESSDSAARLVLRTAHDIGREALREAV